MADKQPTGKRHQPLCKTLLHKHSAGKYVLILTRHIFQKKTAYVLIREFPFPLHKYVLA